MSERHDSGCKSILRMPEGVHGAAAFAGPNDEHRLWLARWWGEAEQAAPFALWAGMNPSGAEADADDMTIRKECQFTRQLGLAHYIKVNAGTYRWTDSTTLNGIGRPLTYEGNFAIITNLADQAAVIVLATGKPPKPLESAARAMLRALRPWAPKVKCLGKTQGWPKHSSRLAYSTPFEDYGL